MQKKNTMNHEPTKQSSNQTLRLVAGTLLILVPTAFMICFILLQTRFDYPDILRKPAADVLTRFAENRHSLLPLWYGMFASAILFIPLSLCVAAVPKLSRGHCLTLASLGLLAGLVQAIGLSRWIFAVPSLATEFVSSTSPQEQFTITTIFNTLNSLLGVGIGEHMGYLFTVGWTLTLAWPIRRTRPITATIGALSAVAIAAGLLEPVGIPSAATINAIGYTVWSLWLIWLGVLLMARKAILASPSA
jgi:hypothetical protein